MAPFCNKKKEDVMPFQIIEEPINRVAGLVEIPIAFMVKSVLIPHVHNRGLGGIILSECRINSPYRKDYDSIEGEGPTTWTKRFDLSKWVFFSAYCGAKRIGGAVVAFDTKELNMLEGRSDLAVLWDIRVAPQMRGQSVGAALFQTVEEWAISKGCKQLKVETQNTNVAACKFYVRRGCFLGAIHLLAYPNLPNEVQLLWYKDLSQDTSSVSPFKF